MKATSNSQPWASRQEDGCSVRAGSLRANLAGTCAWGTLAVVSFQLAQTWPALSWLVPGYLGGLFALRNVPTPRFAFYAGLVVGIATFAPPLAFFWRIFGPGAMALWLVLAFWTGFFLLLLNAVQRRWGDGWASAAAPALWCGIEYFRSELYFLRFSWLTPGSLLAPEVARPVWHLLGVYGTGLLAMIVGVSLVRWVEQRRVVPSLGCLVSLGLGAGLFAGAHGLALRRTPHGNPEETVRVAGVQLEFPHVTEVIAALDNLLRAHPRADLIVLSEYTFDGPIPEEVQAWCRTNRRHLIAGGKEPAPGRVGFFNTAYVVDPHGTIAFQQAKSVPIQFFADGLPAPTQRAWESPWGRIGIAICYDLSYVRVTDGLARQHVQVMVTPTMDVQYWGRTQHELNARMALIRSAEYGLPVVRVASSGISLVTDDRGRVVASAGYPGPGEQVYAALPLRPGSSWHRPWDRVVAPVCTAATAGLILGFGGLRLAQRLRTNL